MHKSFSRWIVAVLLGATLIGACSPQLDWREVRGTSPPFAILLPAKPASLARPVNLDGVTVSMTMTAAEAGGVTYAVGSAQLPAASQAPAALQAMRAALVGNIGGTIRKQATLTAPLPMMEIEALGPPAAATGGQPRLLAARFAAHGRNVYQVVVLGLEKSVSRDAVDTFFTSFKLDQK